MRLKFYSVKRIASLLLLGLPFAVNAQYCTFTATDGVEPITLVNFVTINNVTSGTVGGTPANEDFTSISANVVPGNSYPITVAGNTAGNWTNHIKVYIDWNGNNSFDDAGELYNIGTIVNCTNCSTSGTIAVPAIVPVTSTRMRVVKGFGAGGLSTSCAAYIGYGQAEDYTININSAPCSGVPAGGTATSSVANACPSSSFTLSVTGSGTGLGITYQWQSSPDGIVWTNISGATSAGYTGTQAASTNYRRRIVCATGPDTSYSNAVSVGINPFYNCYCTTAYPSNVEPITLVKFGTINNATSGTLNGTPAQENFTAMSADVVKGLSYPITVNGNTNGNYTNNLAVYFDWNQNGSYADPGETYQLGTITNCTNCGVTVNITIPSTALTGQTGMRVTKKFNGYADACNTTGYGQTEDYTVNILPPPANEAGVLAITKPEVASCSLGSQIWVNLQNLGTSPLTSATFTVKVNGLTVPTTAWTGNVAPQSVAEILVPTSYTFTDGDSVSVEVTMPNGVAENPLFNYNNFTARRLFAGLSGAKSVYGAGANYADITAALTDLYQRGVCDTVYFKLTKDTITSQYTFLPYPGAGAGKLVVFESASGVASSVKFVNTPNAGNNFIFKFDGGDGYMIRNITAIATGTTYATVADIRNGADDISFVGNTFIGDTLGTNAVGDFDRVVIASIQATTDQRTTLKNNTIIGGTRAIILAAPTGAFEEGHVFENNNIINNTAMGLLLGSVSHPVIRGNTFTNRSNVTGDAYNIIVNGSIDGAMFDGNELFTKRSGTNLYLINAKGGASEFVVSNNFINSTDSAGLTRAILIDNASSTGIAIANNSISYRNYNATGGAITVLDGSQIRLLNNNVGAFGSAPVARIEKSYSISQSDYNNLFGTNLANVLGTSYTTLATLQAATGKDAHSVNVNPGFNGADLHTCAAALNGAGLALAFVTADIDGDVRGTNPDIGADEFVADAHGLLLADNFLKCPSDQVTIGNEPMSGVTYSWSPSGNTSKITTTNAGTYIITVTSSCGSYSDTAVVVNKPLPTASFTSYSVGLAAAFTNTSTNGTSYFWDFGDGTTSTDQNPTHIYSAGGIYSVSLTVTNDCGSATSGQTQVNVVSASIEENATINVSLFPNPTNGQFTVTLSAVNNTETSISVIDVTGKTIAVKNIPAGVNQLTLDATSFASGIYSVKITNGDFTKVVRLVRK